MERLNLDKVKILAAAATLAMFAGTACAHVEVFGRVNRAFVQANDGQNSKGLFVDNDYAPSTLGARASMHLNHCVTVGGVVELNPVSNPSKLVNQLDNENGFDVLPRRLDTWVNSQWGKVSLGLGDAASWGVTNMSYAGTNEAVSGVDVASSAGGVYFAANGTKASTSNPTVRNVFMALNGVGDIDDQTGLFTQKNRVRYDTPTWMGLTLGVSYGTVKHKLANSNFNSDSFGSYTTYPATGSMKTFTDAAVRYHGHFHDFMIGAAVGWAQFNRDGIKTEANNLNSALAGTATRGERVWSGSVAVEYKPWEASVAAAYGTKRQMYTSLSNYKMWFVQLGKKFNLTHYGRTAVAVDYFQGKNAVWENSKPKSYGVGVVQDFNKVNTAVYAGVRSYKLNSTPTAWHNLTEGTLGMMFKFGAML